MSAALRARRIAAAVTAALDELYPEGWRDVLAGVEMLCAAEVRAIYRHWSLQAVAA